MNHSDHHSKVHEGECESRYMAKQAKRYLMPLALQYLTTNNVRNQIKNNFEVRAVQFSEGIGLRSQNRNNRNKTDPKFSVSV